MSGAYGDHHLIIGGGGAFKQVLINSGVGNAIAEVATHANINVILFAWLVAGLIRVATGSATVSNDNQPPVLSLQCLHSHQGPISELVVLATGAGSLILSHVNDAGFWMIKEFFNMSVSQTLKTWTVMETLLSVVGLIFILLLSTVV